MWVAYIKQNLTFQPAVFDLMNVCIIYTIQDTIHSPFLKWLRKTSHLPGKS